MMECLEHQNSNKPYQRNTKLMYQAPLTISGSREYDGTQKIESSSMSLSGLQGGETLTINDSFTTSSNVGTYSTGTSTILDGDLNSATFKKISSQEVQCC